ncbi:MAG TPA: hypothetical protein PK096_01105 [Candidatus Saccharibacteria bacterium]|nr:hypothetical protein [Candidatus Saccharibacteria bacterium]HRK93946.1 hypothetical protein [Candidatus Saccharibacteria bacterium]
MRNSAPAIGGTIRNALVVFIILNVIVGVVGQLLFPEELRGPADAPDQATLVETLVNTILWGGVIVVVAVGAAGYYLWRRFDETRYTSELQQFALQRQLKFDTVSSHKTALFRFMNDPGESQRSLGTIAGKGWSLDCYAHTVYGEVKGGRYAVRHVYYSVLRLDLPRELPNIFFDSHKSHGRQLQFRVDNAQRMRFEGNFDTFFTTYSPFRYEIDTLAFITPEVMQAMIAASEYDIELHGRYLYLYGPLLPLKDLDTMVRKAINIHSSLMNNIVTYRDERTTPTTGRHTVDISARNLVKNHFWVTLPSLVLFLSLAVVASLMLLKNQYDLVDKLRLIGAALLLLVFSGVMFAVIIDDWRTRRAARKGVK